MTSIKYNERILYRGIHGELHDSDRLFRPWLIDIAGLLEVSMPTGFRFLAEKES